MIKLVVFDLDGTLLYSLEDLAQSSNFILKKYGFPTYPTEDFRYFVGNGMTVLLQRILPKEIHQTPLFEQIKADFMAHYQVHKNDHTVAYAEIPILLNALQQQSKMIAVATNKIQSAAEELIKDYFPEIIFNAVLGMQAGTLTKPNPSIVLEILNQTKIKKKECIYVGDTSIDVQTAHNAGLKCIGALWGYRSKQELVEAHADFLALSPIDVLNIVAQQQL